MSKPRNKQSVESKIFFDDKLHSMLRYKVVQLPQTNTLNKYSPFTFSETNNISTALTELRTAAAMAKSKKAEVLDTWNGRIVASITHWDN